MEEKISQEIKVEEDRFIAIAAGGKKENGEVKRMAEIPPLQYDYKVIQESDCDVDSRVFDEDKAYAEFLYEKDQLKKKYLPFFEKYSQGVSSPIVREELKDFSYRKETDEDKKNFLRVLNGEGDFENIKLPHYVGPKGRWNAFYRTELNIDKIEDNKTYLLDFEAVDYIAEVYVNGRLAGQHEGFFAPFTVNISDYIHQGKNTLLIVVKNDITTTGFPVNGMRSFGDKIYAETSLGYDEPYEGWHHCPAGAGIIGKVEFVTIGTSRISDVFVRPNIDDGKITVYTTIYNYRLDCPKFSIKYRIEGRNFKEIVVENFEKETSKLSVNTNYITDSFSLSNFKLWTPDSPYLYDITIGIFDENGIKLDEVQTHFGMRKFHMDENSQPKGKFYLNNERVVLRGANEMGHLPRAVMENNDEQLLDDIMIAKVCNMNFFRMTQRPVFKKIYDYFDMTGMMCQTDFPLFSYLKPNKVGEALKQVDEMERLVRNHPCCVLDTFCNETIDKTCWGNEQYCLSRPEIEKFFNAGKEVIEILNPDRVIKYNEGDYAPLPYSYGVTDFHCYTYWYVSHALPSGKLNKGYLPPIKPDWMTSCGEYGCDGLDRWELLNKYCPKEWLPKTETEPWSPKKIAKAQCYALHGDFFLEQENAKGWIEESRKHQTFATKDLTHILRRRADMVQSTAIHLLIDCWPCGWTKVLVDVDRMPKPAYYAYKEALIPLRISLRRDRYVVYSGEKIKTDLFILNDTPKAQEVEVKLNLLLNGKKEKAYKIAGIGEGAIQTYLGSVEYDIPTDFVGQIEIRAEDNNGTYDSVLYSIKQPIKKANRTPILYGEGLENINKICDGKQDQNLIISTRDYFMSHQTSLEDFAYNGGKLIVMMDKPLNVLGEDIIFRMNSLEEEVRANNFIARSSTSKYTKEFDDMDFMNFYNAEKDYQDLTAWFKFDWKDSDEILYTFEDCSDPKYALHKKHKMIVAEKKYGKGSIILSTLSCIRDCVGYNPVLDKFLVNLLEK